MLIKRIRVAWDNLCFIAQYKNSFSSSVLFYLVSKVKTKQVTNGRYQNFTFQFRRTDIPALREVLLEKEYGFLSDLLRATERPLIYDLGAHIGLFSIWAFDQNTKAQIVSFEPDQNNYQVLIKNIALNQKKHEGIWRAEQKAAWDNTSKFISLNRHPTSSMSNTVTGDVKGEIPTVTLEEIIEDAQGFAIDLLKVDIEGAEEKFLLAKPDLLRNVQNLAIELHPSYCDAERTRNILENEFPVIKEIQGRSSSKPLLYCTRMG